MENILFSLQISQTEGIYLCGHPGSHLDRLKPYLKDEEDAKYVFVFTRLTLDMVKKIDKITVVCTSFIIPFSEYKDYVYAYRTQSYCSAAFTVLVPIKISFSLLTFNPIPIISHTYIKCIDGDVEFFLNWYKSAKFQIESSPYIKCVYVVCRNFTRIDQSILNQHKLHKKMRLILPFSDFHPQTYGRIYDSVSLKFKIGKRIFHNDLFNTTSLSVGYIFYTNQLDLNLVSNRVLILDLENVYKENIDKMGINEGQKKTSLLLRKLFDLKISVYLTSLTSFNTPKNLLLAYNLGISENQISHWITNEI